MLSSDVLGKGALLHRSRNNISPKVTGYVEERKLGFRLTLESELIREEGKTSGEARKVSEDNIEVYSHDPGIERDLLRYTKVSHGE